MELADARQCPATGNRRALSRTNSQAKHLLVKMSRNSRITGEGITIRPTTDRFAHFPHSSCLSYRRLCPYTGTLLTNCDVQRSQSPIDSTFGTVLVSWPKEPVKPNDRHGPTVNCGRAAHDLPLSPRAHWDRWWASAHASAEEGLPSSRRHLLNVPRPLTPGSPSRLHVQDLHRFHGLHREGRLRFRYGPLSCFP